MTDDRDADWGKMLDAETRAAVIILADDLLDKLTPHFWQTANTAEGHLNFAMVVRTAVLMGMKAGMEAQRLYQAERIQ